MPPRISCFYAFLLLLPCLAVAQVVREFPPAMERSYKAMGELVEELPEEGGQIIQVAFEEHFDADRNNGVFTIWEMGRNSTFVETGNITLQYDGNTECNVVNKEDWIQVDAPPSILGYSGSNGKMRFSLRQLFDIENKYLIKGAAGNLTSFRNIPAISWSYEIKNETGSQDTTIEVDAFWSNSSFETTSNEKEVPLGFSISKLVYEKNKKEPIEARTQTVSVFAFLHDVVDKKAFRPREGIVCQGRTVNDSMFDTIKFPRMNAFSIKSEFILPDYQQIKTTDIWYDMKNAMLRVDLDRIDNEDAEEKRQRVYTSQITSKALGVMYHLEIKRGSMMCMVHAIEDHPFDVQEIANPRLDAKKWSLEYFVGINTTQYIYLGKTEKRDIPCHLIQGIRTDWPYESAGVTSLWEWCISMKVDILEEEPLFIGDDLGLITAQVNITKSTNSNFPVGYRWIHHFYGAVKENTDALAVNVFDVSRCFQGKQRKSVLFTADVKITSENLATIENATSDVKFLKLWQDQISNACNFTDRSMQVARLQSTVYKNKLYIRFLLLDVHENMPKDIKQKQTTLANGYSALKKVIDTGKLSVIYKPSADAKVITFTAEKDTLKEVIAPNINFSTTTSTLKPTTRYTGPTPSHFSLITDEDKTTPSKGPIDDKTTPSKGPIDDKTTPSEGPNDDKTTTSEGPIDDRSSTPTVEITTQLPTKKQLDGHPQGTVAGVSIFMLLVGISVGAGGTFYYYKRQGSRFG